MKMEKRVIFHIDVNSAFLSWEAVYRLKHLGGKLDLRTIPSAVGGDISKRHGIILAKSIPAKKYHIQTGEPVTDALKKYPETTHREELMYLIVGSGYELAHNSIRSKQTDRYLSMLDSYYSFIAEYPESTHRKEVDRMAKEAKDYLAKNQKIDTQDGN